MRLLLRPPRAGDQYELQLVNLGTTTITDVDIALLGDDGNLEILLSIPTLGKGKRSVTVRLDPTRLATAKAVAALTAQGVGDIRYLVPSSGQESEVVSAAPRAVPAPGAGQDSY